jgi:chromosomal replication initiator protein
MDTFNNIWEKSLEILKQELAGFKYDTWIKSLSPIKREDTTYFFQTQNSVHKDLVEKKYMEQLVSALATSVQLLGHEEQNVSVVLFDSDQVDTTPPPAPPAVNSDTSMLNQAYTFDTFVVGSSNEFAHAAARAVADKPGQTYNPLFIYGKTGLGKTHLMQAVASYIKNADNNSTVMFVKSEPFLNELINAIRTSKTEEFRKRYRKADVLLIDDIQFIAGKESTQEEFFHTFNELYENNKQIILSSDKPPKEISKLEERLRSRFEGGLIADIQPPNYETKLAILQRKVKDITSKDALRCEVSPEILDLIATKVSSNIRSLEGALNKIIAYTVLNGKSPNIVEAEIAIRDFLTTTTNKKVSSKHILQMICEYFEISEAEIISDKRNQSISYPRQIAMYLTRKLCDMSYQSIAELYGKSDHTTVKHAFEKIEKEIVSKIEVKTLVDDFVTSLHE